MIYGPAYQRQVALEGDTDWYNPFEDLAADAEGEGEDEDLPRLHRAAAENPTALFYTRLPRGTRAESARMKRRVEANASRVAREAMRRRALERAEAAGPDILGWRTT
jgi:hypothetical protein